MDVLWKYGIDMSRKILNQMNLGLIVAISVTFIVEYNVLESTCTQKRLSMDRTYLILVQIARFTNVVGIINMAVDNFLEKHPTNTCTSRIRTHNQQPSECTRLNLYYLIWHSSCYNNIVNINTEICHIGEFISIKKLKL